MKIFCQRTQILKRDGESSKFVRPMQNYPLAALQSDCLISRDGLQIKDLFSLHGSILKCYHKLLQSWSLFNLIEWKELVQTQFFHKMGHTLSTPNESPEDQSSTLRLALQCDRKVIPDLKPLLNWSLSEIRQIYAPFRRRKGSPILTRSQFLRFINLSRISSFHIYDCITKSEQINVFEIVAILAMGAYTSYVYKLQFLFNVFDLKCRKKMSFTELILMYKSIVRGFCFLTGQPLPDNQVLEKFGLAMFSKADLNNDQLLQIGEIIGWLETASQNLVLFKLFEPPIYGKEDYHIFNSFIPYTNDEVNVLLARLQKLYCRQKIDEEDYLLLRPIVKVRKDESALKSGLSQTWGKGFDKSLSLDKDKQNISPRVNSKTGTTVNNSTVLTAQNSSFLPQIGSSLSKYHRKKKFENIIIIKGRSITKKQVFELRQYFDSMSVGKRHIIIEDFIENFNQEKYNHMKSVAASLFNFLDKHQNGKIQFLDLVTKLYPNLSLKHLETISAWSEQYNRNFNISKKIKTPHNSEEYKKRILPKTCIIRLQELFRFFDEKNKGYVDINDLRRVLSNACNEKEIKQLFDNSDGDRDGRLTLKEFVHVLLPPDLEIEGLV